MVAKGLGRCKVGAAANGLTLAWSPAYNASDWRKRNAPRLAGVLS